MYDLRVVGLIDSTDMENYTEAGFRLIADVGGELTDLSKKVSCCFTKLLARNEGGAQIELMAPEEYYFIALTVTRIPENVLPTFTGISDGFRNAGFTMIRFSDG